tara:strand:+ start:1627 stop:2400 length:774 start_codon:yes stop_codon:yes gene_type:complete
MDQYIVNEKQETEEGNMSLEEQLAQQEAAKTSEGQPPSGSEEQQPEAEEELILGKFRSQEDLAEAYENLEKKLGETKQQEQVSEENSTEQNSNVSEAIQSASDAFYNEGALSEENYKALEENGIPREFVEAYVRGQEATMESEVATITNSIGGQENYEAMSEWARNNLPSEEIDSFDQIVESSTPDAAKMAVKGLYARFISEGGQQPTIRQGQTSGSAVQPFNSSAQVVEAMKDRRYETDPAYREEVERRLAVSTRV